MNEPVKNEIQLFEDQKIRVAWDAEQEEWYFSVAESGAVQNVACASGKRTA